MTRRSLQIVGTASVVAMLVGSSALAGPYGDDLSKCLVIATEHKDKTDLVRFIFAAAAQHPDVSNIASISDKQRTEMARTVGRLYERLLTESCRTQYRDAVKYEGQQVLPMSFSVLGQVAMRGLMENPAVTKAFGEIDTFLDKDKINAVTQAAEK